MSKHDGLFFIVFFFIMSCVITINFVVVHVHMEQVKLELQKSSTVELAEIKQLVKAGFYCGAEDVK